MPRANFYGVEEAAYLFPIISVPSGDRDHPEEEVRQWCAFELIRTYGFRINDISFEKDVKIGSRTYRIDILVFRDGTPLIVVECKPRDFKRSSKGVDQAISYADAQTIRAEYVLYTNGHDWLVQRRVRDQWIATPDIPLVLAAGPSPPVSNLFFDVDRLSPLLHGLDQDLQGQDAEAFLHAMQQFFSGTNTLTQDTDQDLRFATGNLLRVLCSPDRHPDYCRDKLEYARRDIERFRCRAGIGYPIVGLEGTPKFWQEFRPLANAVVFMLEGTDGLASSNVLLLRVVAALMQQGLQTKDSSPAKWTITKNVHLSLREFLDFTLKLHLNAQLPDSLDHTSVSDMRIRCESDWEQLKREVLR